MATDQPPGADTEAASRLPAIATRRLFAAGALAKVADTEVPPLVTPVADWITVQVGVGVGVGVLVDVDVLVAVGVGVGV
jgi:hypothetical protein